MANQNVTIDDLRAAMAPHVVFDGWSEAAFDMACADLDVPVEVAKRVCPRGAMDVAVAYHKAGDAEMIAG
ncbi:MAG: COQ9 family protein, partial [Halocynthiibacter sp.]